MGLLDRLKGGLEGRLAKLNGNLDFLQAACAHAALQAMADGVVSPDEEKAGIEAICANPIIKGAFTPRQIETTFMEMLSKKGFTGKNQLMREIEDVNKKDPRGELGMAETVLLVGLDVAAGDGDIGEKEKKVAEDVAKRLGLNLNDYLN